MNSVEFCVFLLTKVKVAVVPSGTFGELGEGLVRFSYTTNYETIKGMEKVKSALVEL